MRGRAASLAAVASLLLIVAGGIAVASQRERHQLGTNWVRPIAFVAKLLPGERICQDGMNVPAGTGGVGMRIGTYGRGGPPLTLSIRAAQRPEVRGTLRSGWQQGDVVVMVPSLGVARRDATVCLRNEGDGPIAIAGGPGIGAAARTGGDSVGAMIRLEYVESERRMWVSVVPDVFDRVAVARDALPGKATLPLFALLSLFVLGGSVALVVREARR